MDATQLSKDLEAAGLVEFGPNPPAEVFPSAYFNHTVRVIAPDGSSQPRAPKNCATALAASQLAEILGASSVVMGNAVIFSGLLDSWSDSELVPYFVFTDSKDGSVSKPVNAGLLLDYFNHGSSPGQVKQALAGALNEIKGAFA